MIALKWLLIIVSVGYACGLAGLFFMQRSFLFPSPQTIRTRRRPPDFRKPKSMS